MEVFESLADLIGNTPVVHLKHFAEGCDNKLLGKCEFMNPGGSIKDRIALNMVEEAEKTGKLKAGGGIVEATAGNTGIGLALVAALKGYKLIAVMSEKVSKDKVNMLETLGAEAVVVPSGKKRNDPEHFMNKAISIAEKNSYWLADQFNNPSNIEAHYKTTAREIWRQTDGTIDVLVAGAGTGGTLTGCGRYLKEQKAEVKIVLADPVGSLLADLVGGRESEGSSYLVEGIGQDFVPGNLDTSIIDDVISVSDSDSIKAAKRLWEKEAMFVGSSSGCIAHAAVAYIEKHRLKDKTVMAILPDGGRSYISTIYNPEWLQKMLPEFH